MLKASRPTLTAQVQLAIDLKFRPLVAKEALVTEPSSFSCLRQADNEMKLAEHKK
jgi:hypothetical protein